MNLKDIKIYHSFWIITILILIIGIYINNSTENSIFDLNIHDTYYVITNFDLSILLSFLYFINGFGYWFVEKKLNRKLIKSLTIIHSIIFIGGFITYWLVYLYVKMNSNKSFPLFDDYETINETLVIIFILIVAIGIPIYIINLLIGIIFKRKAFR
jgi:heme/copper-type cytochrome/quinol oxidase subunit 1